MSASTQPVERISVALCTYNGERFLAAQLESILRQTRQPDELVLCDDCSGDRTVAIAREFAARAPFAVRLVENRENYGSNRNFEQAIRLCTGDLIVLSDQDDLWATHRIERSAAALARHPECGLVFSNAFVIDEEGRRTGNTLWQNFRFTPAMQARLRRGDYTPLAQCRFITGATVTFRAKYRTYLFPVIGEWVHDGWLAMMIACLSGICFVAEPLIEYRQHAAQQVGLRLEPERRPRGLEAHAARHWSFLDALRIILADVVAGIERLPIDRTRGAAADLLRHYAFLSDRLELPANRLARLARMLRMSQEYRIGMATPWAVPKDLILPKLGDERGAAARAGFSLMARPESTVS